jgi:hypothetical protein
MMIGTAEETGANISVILPFLKFTSKHENGTMPSWVPDFEALATGDGHRMALQSKFHAGGEFEHLEHARLLPANNRVLGLRGVVRSLIMSLADLEPLPLDSFDVECFEYRAEGHLVQSYAIPTWEDCLRMLHQIRQDHHIEMRRLRNSCRASYSSCYQTQSGAFKS